VLVVGVTIALVRADREIDSRADFEQVRANAARATYEAALRQAAVEPARFAVSFVEMPLKVARRFARGQYEIVPTEVARRMETGAPPVRPDFARLAGARTDLEARVFRERGVREREVYVVGLLVTQTTPGLVARLRLEVDRLELTSFTFVWDPLDLLPDSRTAIFRRNVGVKTNASIEWKPRIHRTGFVPLAFLHLFRVLRTPAGQEYMESGLHGIQVTSHVALGPHRLLVKRGARSGFEEIAIKDALHPVVLSASVGPRP
jgi:hypothetical protein